MSSFDNALSPHQASTPQASLAPPELRKSSSTAVQDFDDPSSTKSKTVRSAFGKLWRAIKQPKKILARHLNGSRRLRLIARRTKKGATPLEKPSTTLDAGHNSGPAPPSIRSVAIAQDASSEPLTLPGPPSTSSAAIVQEAPSEPLTLPDPPSPRSAAVVQGAPSEPLTLPDLPSAVTTGTESSISLSSLSDPISLPTHIPDGRQPPGIINFVNNQFRSDDRPGTPLSEASTLQNSTFVNDDFSRHASEVQRPSTPEATTDPTIDASPASPPTPSQPTRPFTPRLQTSFGQLNVPGSDDEDSRSTIRRRGSSPASAVDFHGMGGLFHGSPGH